MKTYRALLEILVLAIVLCGIVSESLATDNPAKAEDVSNSIDWYYWSPLSVVENITDIGGGSYRYEYSLVNIDSSPIWHFGINTTFVTDGGAGGTTFSGHETWGGPDWVSVDSAAPEYDARNLDPAMLGFTNTWTLPWQDPVTAIQISEATSGFSFTASVYDPTPKYYFYETIESGYTQTNGTGKVAAVGLTVPEPTTVALLGLGALSLIRRKRSV